MKLARGGEGPRASVQPRDILEEMMAIMRETFPRNIVIQERCSSDLRSVLADGTGSCRCGVEVVSPPPGA